MTRSSTGIALREKLERGSVLAEGITLTPEECQELLQLLGSGARGRPPDDIVYARDQIVAQLFALYVANGDSTKVAIERLKKRFGMGRSQIFDAKKRYPQKIRSLDPSELSEMIFAHENNPLV